MGNTKASKNDDFHKILSEMKKDQSRRININPDKKYLALMKETLPNTRLPERLKTLILETLNEKVTEVELIQTVTCINALRNNQFQSSFARSQLVLKERPESKFVRVNFGQGIFQKMLRNFNPSELTLSDSNSQSSSPTISPKKTDRPAKSYEPYEDSQPDLKEKLKVITQVMKKQLNRAIHPFGRLNKAFAEYVEDNSHDFAPKNSKEEVYERSVHRLVNQWCGYLQSSCMFPYKKWLMSYTELEQKKYCSWLRNMIMQQIWVVNNGYLFGMFATVIQRCKIPLKIDIKELHQSAALLTPSFFSIDTKLQIEGHLFDSIYEMSEVVSQVRPQKILSQLQTVKKRVCTDIDNYHRLVELGEVYEIDSDNILGIVSYILCKIATKIDEIHTHLIFLRIIYGDKVYFTMGLGSYMLSTVFGALEFLESEQFMDLLDEKRNKLPQGSGQGKIDQTDHIDQNETKVGTSVPGSSSSIPGQTSSIPELGSQPDPSTRHTNSLFSVS